MLVDDFPVHEAAHSLGMRDLSNGNLAVDVFDDFADIIGKMRRVVPLVGLDDMAQDGVLAVDHDEPGRLVHIRPGVGREHARLDRILVACELEVRQTAFDHGLFSVTVVSKPAQLPPVNAFWSLTLYVLPSSLLSANRLNRYLINSPMLPDLKRDADGGVTFYVQHDTPGADKEANWLPAPSGPFFMALRLYWPKPEALEGTWKAPPLERVN